MSLNYYNNILRSFYVFSYECDTLEYYNRQFDKVTLKNTAPLQKFKRVFHKVTTTDDPYNLLLRKYL